MPPNGKHFSKNLNFQIKLRQNLPYIIYFGGVFLFLICDTKWRRYDGYRKRSRQRTASRRWLLHGTFFNIYSINKKRRNQCDRFIPLRQFVLSREIQEFQSLSNMSCKHHTYRCCIVYSSGNNRFMLTLFITIYLKRTINEIYYVHPYNEFMKNYKLRTFGQYVCFEALC